MQNFKLDSSSPEEIRPGPILLFVTLSSSSFFFIFFLFLHPKNIDHSSETESNFSLDSFAFAVRRDAKWQKVFEFFSDVGGDRNVVLFYLNFFFLYFFGCCFAWQRVIVEWVLWFSFISGDGTMAGLYVGPLVWLWGWFKAKVIKFWPSIFLLCRSKRLFLDDFFLGERTFAHLFVFWPRFLLGFWFWLQDYIFFRWNGNIPVLILFPILFYSECFMPHIVSSLVAIA